MLLDHTLLASFLGHVGGGKWPGGEAKIMPCTFTALSVVIQWHFCYPESIIHRSSEWNGCHILSEIQEVLESPFSCFDLFPLLSCYFLGIFTIPAIQSSTSNVGKDFLKKSLIKEAASQLLLLWTQKTSIFGSIPWSSWRVMYSYQCLKSVPMYCKISGLIMNQRLILDVSAPLV